MGILFASIDAPPINSSSKLKSKDLFLLNHSRIFLTSLTTSGPIPSPGNNKIFRPFFYSLFKIQGLLEFSFCSNLSICFIFSIDNAISSRPSNRHFF